jgi:hypothetical protein
MLLCLFRGKGRAIKRKLTIVTIIAETNQDHSAVGFILRQWRNKLVIGEEPTTEKFKFVNIDYN